MSVSYGIDPGSTAGFFRVNNGKSFGPFQHGSDLYDTGYFAIDGGYTYLGIYKSTDSGVTWTRQAAGTSPRLTWVSEFYPGTGTVIYFAYLDGFSAGGNFNPRVCLASFDMATDLLTIINNTTGPVLTLNYHDSNEPPNTAPQVELQLSRLSDGTLVVEYATINVFYDLYAQTFKAGVWAAAQQLNTNAPAQSGYQPYGIGVTSNDKIYCLWYSGDDGAIYSSKLVAGVLSVPVQAFPPFGLPSAVVWRTAGFYLPISDALIWNAPLTGGASRMIELIVLSAAGTGAGSFSTWDTTQTVSNTGTRGIMDFSFNPAETEFYVYYASTDDAIAPLIQISLVKASTLLGVFGAPSIVWNYPTDTINPNYVLGGLAGPPLETFFATRITTNIAFLWGVAAQIPGTSGIGESGITYFLSSPLPPIAASLNLNQTLGVQFSVKITISLACPVQNTGVVGTPFSSTLIPLGGVPPFVFAIIAGALPPGLTLDPFTGLISGVPTLAGVFDYTAQVTDNVGSTATASCEITISAQPNPVPTPPAGHNTLRWQVDAKDRPGRWFHHKYAHAIVSHYLVEPSASLPNTQDLYLLGPDIFISGGNTDAGTAISTFVLTPANDFGDERAQKLYPDAMLQIDGTGTLFASPAFDNAQAFAPPTVITPTGTIQQFLVNIASLANLVLHRNIGVALAWTGGPDGPRVQAWEPAAYLQPYLSEFLVTQFINWSYPDWKMCRRLYPALISTAPVIFTLKCQDGRTFSYTIPSTGGQFLILPMMCDHGLKDLSVAAQLDGQGTKFALFPDAFTLEVKGWADPEYINLAIFKT